MRRMPLSISRVHMRSLKVRPYRMHRRAEQVALTRQRITEAAMLLHTSIGPANTSLAGVAAQAGVTRLTVYRHFPDLESLFVACSGHWMGLNPPPDIDAWRAIPNLEDRARTALRELYGWYREHGDDLFPIYRDIAAMPVATQEAIRTRNAAAAALIGGDAPTGVDARRLRAVAGHLVSFWTWRSLTHDEGLQEAEAIELAVDFLSGAATVPPR